MPCMKASRSAPRGRFGPGPFIRSASAFGVRTQRADLLSMLNTALSGADDRPSPACVAAAATRQGGLLLKGSRHHLAWAFVSGRRAGRFAAAEPPEPAGASADT